MKIHELNADGVSLGHEDGHPHGKTWCGYSGIIVFERQRRTMIAAQCLHRVLLELSRLVGVWDPAGGPLNGMNLEPIDPTTCTNCLREKARANRAKRIAADVVAVID